MTAPTHPGDSAPHDSGGNGSPQVDAGETAPAAALSRLRYTAGDGYLHVTLDRPAHSNALDPTSLTELDHVLSLAEGMPRCRVLVLAATGNSFCCGMDAHVPVSAVGDADGPGTGDGELPYWRLLERLTNTELVTIALVDGDATGGGVGLAAACDLVLAGAHARFRLTEVLLGLIPAMALPFVARRMGEQHAFRAALLAETLDAKTAVAAGLADRFGPAADQLLRPLLVSLRRVDRATAAALKQHRAALFPFRPSTGQEASALFLSRLADPTVGTALARLRTGTVAQQDPEGAR